MPEKNYYALFDKPTLQNLEANQRGRLTIEQQLALDAAIKSQRQAIVFFGVLIFSLFAFILVVFLIIGRDNGISSPQNLVFSVGIVALGLGGFYIYLARGALVLVPKDEIRDGQVEFCHWQGCVGGRPLQVRFRFS